MKIAGRLLPELRRTLRTLRRSPGFAVSVIAVFALGIGVSTTMWSAVHALLLSPLPLHEPQRLAALYQVSPEDPRRPVAPANFLDWRRQARSFSALAAWSLDLRVVTGLGEPRRLSVAWTSSNFFDLLGAQPIAGRLFHGGESGAPAVISHRAWQQVLGGAPVDGKVLRVGGRAVEIVGVAPRSLDFPPGVELWAMAPRDVPPLGLPGAVDATTLRDARYLGVVGRLARDATMASADAELQTIARRLERAYPDANAHNGARVVPLAEDLGRESRLPLLLLLAAAVFVLLVGCLNVAGLMVARTVRRQRTLAVQAAIGGGAAALALPVLIESLLLAAAGGVAGVLLAVWAGPRLLAALPGAVLGGRELDVSAAVVAFAVAASLLTAVGTALLPVLAATRNAPAALLSSARATSSPLRARARSTLVVAQVALAFVLVVGASLLIRTLAMVAARSPGFSVERVVTSRLALPPDPTLPPAARRALLTRAVETAAAAPGVRDAGAVLKLPLTGSGMSSDARVEGSMYADGEAPDVCWRAVTPGYFSAIGMPLLRGRSFGAQDGAGSAPTAVVNRTLAAQLWPGRDPLGRRLATGLDGDGWVTVVGVVGDAPQEAVDVPARPEMYRPLLQESRFGGDSMVLVARTGPGFSGEALREALHAVSPLLVVEPLEPLAEVVRRASARPRLLAAVLGFFGGATLLLAAIGLYSLLVFLVDERRRELSVRVALGARPAAAAGLVMRDGLLQVAIGAAVGLVASLLLGSALASRLATLTKVPISDPWVLPAAAAVLAVAAVAASSLPARRAARTDPAMALRGD